jgi:drug/metabolite transporter (DMT)-like permease
MSSPNQNLRGIALMAAATCVFTINDTFLKLATEGMAPFQALFLRGIFASLWGIPLVVFTGNAGRLAAMFKPRVLARNSFELAAVLFFIVALANLPIADITALVQVAPMLMLVGVAFIYREAVRPIQWLLIIVGFAGALLVAQPGGAGFSVFTLLGLGCAVMTAGRDIVGRRVPKDIPGPVVAFGTLSLVMVGAGIAHGIFETWTAPAPMHWLYLAGSGLFLMFGHLFVFLAYRTGDVGAVAPFFYTFTLWSLVSGVLVFGTWPNPLALTGMLLILVSGVTIVTLDSRRRTRDNTEEVPVA